MGIFKSDVLFKNQKYEELKKKALKNEVLFKDPEFPPFEKSIWKHGGDNLDIEWKRPKDLCEEPHLVSDGRIACHNLIQGELGNCWLVAACSCLAVDRDNWEQVVPDLKMQEWDYPNTDNYAGIFHFRFWRFGEWVDVVVDDLLPCRQGKLIFTHSRTKNEFWCCLLEKAYAKLLGSYDGMEGGELSEALEDLTGGVTEVFDLGVEKFQDEVMRKDTFFSTLLDHFNDHALMAAAIPAVSTEDMEKVMENGLVMGHAYSVTSIKKVSIKGSHLFGFLSSEKLQMIRLRNPWGETEWKGAFGQHSEEWTKLSHKEKINMGLIFAEAGEFWMTFDDFLKNLMHLSVCKRLNESFFSLSKRWHPSQFEGDWKYPNTCGGCVNNKDTFLENPQYAFTMSEDEDVFVVLTQKKSKKKSVIGFTIMKVEENRTYRLHKAQEILDSSPFKDSRSVMLKRKGVLKGRYVIVVCLYNQSDTGEYLLRIFLGSSTYPIKLHMDMPVKSMCPCMPYQRFPELVTQVTVARARNLYRNGSNSPKDVNAYLILKCEGDKVESRVMRGNSSPEFNFSAIFFHRNPAKNPIIIDVWHQGAVKDEHIGRLLLLQTYIVEEKVQELSLTLKKDPDTPSDTGSLVFTISTSFNLMKF